MTVEEAIKSRYACRSYKDQNVSDELLKKVIDTARNAPSASNRQEWRIVAVTEKKIIKQLNDKADNQGWWKTAPVLLACCADTNNHVMKCRQLCYTVDLSIIIDHITLLATENGLATCWIGAFDEDVIKEILSIPRHIRIVEMLALGYPADSARPKTRLDLDKILFRNKWEEKF
jgi:nitroreductase